MLNVLLFYNDIQSILYSHFLGTSDIFHFHIVQREAGTIFFLNQPSAQFDLTDLAFRQFAPEHSLSKLGKRKRPNVALKQSRCFSFLDSLLTKRRVKSLTFLHFIFFSFNTFVEDFKKSPTGFMKFCGMEWSVVGLSVEMKSWTDMVTQRK